LKKEERYSQVLSWFRQHFQNAGTELNYDNDFQLLVAVILSAQCTDKRVNIITEKLFADYPDALSMSKATQDTIKTLYIII